MKPGVRKTTALQPGSLTRTTNQKHAAPSRDGPPRLLVGLMSGTSADGVDAAVVKISDTGGRPSLQLVAAVHRAFPASLRRRILEAASSGTVGEICHLNFLLGEHFARAALAALNAGGFRAGEITAIGSHGQTIHHLPGGKRPSTLQIGEPAVIAERTGILTVADFRVADVAAGGQGAPLVPYADWVMFADNQTPRIVQNIGGIANATFLPPTARLEDVLAFDTGPGNMVIDAVAAKLSGGRLGMDAGGRWAARGAVSARLLADLMEHPFLRRRPPKTTGREEFGEAFVGQVLKAARRLRVGEADIMATVTEFTVATIAEAYRRFIFPKLLAGDHPRLEIVLGGGGAKNTRLRTGLARRIGVGTVRTHEDFGVPSEAKEAMAFALLAYETLRGRPSNVPGATGARRRVVLGKIAAPGAN